MKLSTTWRSISPRKIVPSLQLKEKKYVVASDVPISRGSRKNRQLLKLVKKTRKRPRQKRNRKGINPLHERQQLLLQSKEASDNGRRKWNPRFD